jgi:hypothetical protein
MSSLAAASLCSSKTNVTALPADAGRLLALSLSEHKVLSLLRKGCAYHVRGAWRFRGHRGHIREATLLSLERKSLAERAEIDGRVQFRVTAVGCSVIPNRLTRRARSLPRISIVGG